MKSQLPVPNIELSSRKHCRQPAYGEEIDHQLLLSRIKVCMDTGLKIDDFVLREQLLMILTEKTWFYSLQALCRLGTHGPHE